MEYITDFPSEQAEALQKHLKELDEQGKLKEEFLKSYQNNMGKPNSLANYIDKNWETRGKKLYMEYTGIEVYNENDILVKNVGIHLNDVAAKADRRFLWKCCNCGNEWTTRIKNRVRLENNCKLCSDKQGSLKLQIPKKGKSAEEFCQQHPERGKIIEKEWTGIELDANTDSIIATNVKLKDVNRGSLRYFQWKCCKCGNTWKASMYHRITKGTNCKQCSIKEKVIPVRKISYESSLEYYCHKNKFGNIIKNEWTGIEVDKKTNETIRTGVKMDDIANSSGKKFKWKCSNCGNLFNQAISNRTRLHQGCPKCKTNQTSFPEQYIFLSLKEVLGDIVSSRKLMFKDKYRRGLEFDIFIDRIVPNTKYKAIAIEYNSMWHNMRDTNRDKIKKDECEKNSIMYIGITEYNTFGDFVVKNDKWSTYIKQYVSDDCEQLQTIITNIIKLFDGKHKVDDIDFNKVYKEAYKNAHGRIAFEDSIASIQLLHQDFDSNKNSISDTFIKKGSNLIVWWKCHLCGHEWQSMVYDRAHKCTQCPKCHGNELKFGNK